MREDLDKWSLHVEKEDVKSALARLLIAFDELRARLAPVKYPNIEISDEGYLWFNIDSTERVEVIALPFGFEAIKPPSILVSFPCKAEDVSLDFLRKLNRISDSTNKFDLFAGFSTSKEILDAYRRNKHPSLTCTQNFEKILKMKKLDVFFSYFGICFPILGKNVSDVERTIKEILFKLENHGCMNS